MSVIPGTNVAAPVVPFDTEDNIPTHYPVYGYGGWREVETVAELNLIPEERRSDGMAAWVREEAKIYILTSGSWDVLNDFTEAAEANEQTAINAAIAEAAAISAGQAAMDNNFYPNARSYVPCGLDQTSVGAITGGSGGTNGTFNLAWTGGNFTVAPSGTFTVVGGAVTSINITGPGYYVGASPTAPTPVFTASAGLTGASCTMSAGFLVGSGGFYLTDHAMDAAKVARYQNQSGVAVEVDSNVDYLDVGAAQVAAVSATTQAQAAARSVLQGQFRLNGRSTYLDVLPGASWNGTAGSGYTSTPVDPTRSTAKPTLRLMVPPNQFFTDYLVVGVMAGASFNQSLSNNMGLEKVTVYYEGRAVDILEPSFRTFPDANGKLVTYFGWWVVLLHNGVTNGNANVYFEAVPKDTTMQNRVQGPYQFSPYRFSDGAGGVRPYDFVLQISPSQAVVAGSRYQTIAAAMTYLKGQSAKNPLVQLTETAQYSSMTVGAPVVTCDGYFNVEALEGVTATIGYTAFGSVSILRPYWDGMHFKGSNIVFDMRYTSAILCEGGNVISSSGDVTGRNHWVDGVTFMTSAQSSPVRLAGSAAATAGAIGLDRLWGGRTRPNPYVVGDYPWITECIFQCLGDPLRGSQLARGNRMEDCWNDQMSGSLCAIGNTFIRCENIWLVTEVPSLQVQYTGTGTAATMEISGQVGASSRVITVKVEGVSIGTFTIANSSAGHLAGTNYTMQNVADWLNSLGNITATVLSSAYAAGYLMAQGQTDAQSNTPATSIKTGYTFAAHAWPHGDLYASEGATHENIIISGNVSYDCYDLQIIMGEGTSTGYVLKDWLIMNNRFQHWSDQYWQMQGTQSHVIVAHNSVPDYQLTLRIGASYASYYTQDADCLIANNALSSIADNNTNTNFNGKVRNNHTVSTGNQSTSPGHTVGGTVDTLVVNRGAGDYTPASILQSNPKLPTIRFDAVTARRPLSDVVGALAG